jgi:hypothetical protein
MRATPEVATAADRDGAVKGASELLNKIGATPMRVQKPWPRFLPAGAKVAAWV